MPTTRYTDASPYQDQPAHAISVIDAAGKELSAATVLTKSTEIAEEAAIALAATTGKEWITIITDSQTACRNYLNGRISKPALHILQRHPQFPSIEIVWSPGHTALEGNGVTPQPENIHTGPSPRGNHSTREIHIQNLCLFTHTHKYYRTTDRLVANIQRRTTD